MMALSVTTDASHLPLDPEPAIAGLGGWMERFLGGRADLSVGAQEMGKAMAKEGNESVRPKQGLCPFYGL